MSAPRLLHLTTIDYSLRVLLGYQLRRFAQEGFQVLGASAPGPWVADLEADGIEHVPVSNLTRVWNPLTDAAAVRELVSIFRRVRPDVVHTHNPKSGVLGRVAARLARVPVVVNTVHGLYDDPTMPRSRRWVITNAERWAARLSHHEFFQSAEDHERAVRTGMVRADRASVLGNGVDLRRFDPTRVDPQVAAAFRAAWGAGPDDRIVGVVGRLVREKGYLEFFSAARRIAASHPDVRFVVIGSEEPDKDDRITAAQLERAREDGVVFHGEEQQMPEAYAALDLFALPSYREGMPRSAIEASAMGLPVVATRIRGCREVVADGETGLLVPAGEAAPLAEAIQALLADPQRRARMGAAGAARARERFDEDGVVDRSLEVYRRLQGARR